MSPEQPPQPNLTLYRGWVDRGCYVWSPFVTKLELRLRLSNVRYTVEAGSPSTAPKGKIPYIEMWPQEGPPLVLADSTLIIKRLVELDYLEDLATALSSPTRAHDLAIRALLEDKLYFYHVSAAPHFPKEYSYSLEMVERTCIFDELVDTVVLCASTS